MTALKMKFPVIYKVLETTNIDADVYLPKGDKTSGQRGYPVSMYIAIL